METIRTFTAYNALDGNVNITLELIKYGEHHYEIRETHSTDCTCDKEFTITRKFDSYDIARSDFDSRVNIIIEFAEGE